MVALIDNTVSVTTRQSDNVPTASDVAMALEELLSWQGRARRTTQPHSFATGFGKSRVNPLAKGFDFAARHFGQEREHDARGRISFAVG